MSPTEKTTAKHEMQQRRLKIEISVLSCILVGVITGPLLVVGVEGYLVLLGHGDVFALAIMIGAIGTILTIMQRMGFIFQDYGEETQ